MSIKKAQKQAIIEEYQLFEGDTGSPEVQVALLTAAIEEVIDHLRKHKRDNNSRKGLLKKVSKRRRLLNFLMKLDEDRYKKMIVKVGLKR